MENSQSALHLFVSLVKKREAGRVKKELWDRKYSLEISLGSIR